MYAVPSVRMSAFFLRAKRGAAASVSTWRGKDFAPFLTEWCPRWLWILLKKNRCIIGNRERASSLLDPWGVRCAAPSAKTGNWRNAPLPCLCDGFPLSNLRFWHNGMERLRWRLPITNL